MKTNIMSQETGQRIRKMDLPLAKKGELVTVPGLGSLRVTFVDAHIEGSGKQRHHVQDVFVKGA